MGARLWASGSRRARRGRRSRGAPGHARSFAHIREELETRAGAVDRTTPVTEDGLIATTTHSAPGQAAGYEYQRQLALVLLAEAYREDPLVAVRLEAIEDVELVWRDGEVVGVQAKHHLRDHTLTDRSPDLWRTLTGWMDLERQRGADALPRLHLVTTSRAAAGTAVALLRHRNRDVVTALGLLREVAGQPGAEATRGARHRFLDLPESAQLRILHAATVLDAAERVDGLDERLRAALGMVVPQERPEAFLQRIVGWWVGRSTELLVGRRQAITGQELYELCDAVRDDFRSGSLTVTGELRDEPHPHALQPLLERPFVRQLRLVRAPDPVTDLAIRHYYRAYAQRGRWAREVEGLDGDFTAFEQTLTDEWETQFTAMGVRAPADSDGRAREGLELALDFGVSTKARLRGVDEHVLCRGTAHGLADRRRIGWHPDYQRLMSDG